MAFFTSLQSDGMFTGDTKDHVTVQPMKAKKVPSSLGKSVEPTFSGVGNSNKPQEKLLAKMKETSFPAATYQAKEFESGGKLLHACIIQVSQYENTW